MRFALSDVIVCPACRGALKAKEEAHEEVSELRCGGCGRRYPVIEGIPVLLEERAEREQP